MKFKRVVLKISGEALMGDRAYGISTEVIKFLSQEIQALHHLKIELGLVVGAGNIFRGVSVFQFFRWDCAAPCQK